MSAAAAIAFKKVRNTNPAIVRSTFRRILRGSIILGFFIGGIFAMQGLAYAKTYTTEHARIQFAKTLESAPALGMIYGEPKNIDTPAGYMVYRAMPITALIAGIWGLLVITKQLRGQEEDGRWEMLLSGQTTTRQAALYTLLGGLGGALVAYTIAAILIVLTGNSPDINLPVGTSILLATATLSPAIVFMGIGVFVSQLANIRRRAVLYGLIPLLALFFLRSMGNVVEDVHWLKDFTPFGWIENMHLVTDFQSWWFVLPVITALAAMVIGVYLAGKRDLGESLIAGSDISKPNFHLLNRPWKFSFRLTRWSLLAWLIGGTAIFSMIAAISSIASQAAGDSDSLTQALSNLAGGNNSLNLAFLGMASLLLGVVLMAMMATGISSIRDEEARSYLDNIVVGPVARTRWLMGRLGVLAGAAIVTAVVVSTVGWLIATKQGIDVDFSTMVVGDLSLLGPVFLLLGIGTLLYGLSARSSHWAAPFMYVVLAWSFIVDLLASVLNLNQIVANSSLLHYIAFVPAAQPDWKACWILTGVAILLTAVGIVAFNRRDLETE